MKRNIILAVFIILAVLALSLSGCSANNQPAASNPAASNPANTNTSVNQSTNSVNQNSNSNSPSSTDEGPVASAPVEATGNLQFRVTDAPAKQEITKIDVTITGVEVHLLDKEGTQETEQEQETVQEADAEQNQNDNSNGWQTIELENSVDSVTFDLFEVKANPLTIANVPIPAGTYTQIRLEVSAVNIYFADNIEKAVPAIVPSGKIKLINTFEVGEGSTTDLLCDFDAAQSVNISGNGKVMFKPVIKVTAGKPEKNNNGDKDNNKVKALKITTPEVVTVVRDNDDDTVKLNLNAIGGVKPYEWSINEGQADAPADLKLDKNTGKILFTDKTTGLNTFKFDVSVTDKSGLQVTKTLEINVVDLMITTESLGTGVKGVEFTSVQLEAEGGSGDYTWDIIEGEVPGLTLEDGVLSGTPTQSGEFVITVQVTDGTYTATQEYTLNIEA